MKRPLSLIFGLLMAGAQAQSTPVSCNGKSGSDLQSCRQMIAKENARRISQGLAPLADTAKDPGQTARESLSRSVVKPVQATVIAQTPQQKAEAAKNPQQAAEWARKSQAVLQDTSGLKELTAVQVMGLIRAAQKEVLIISAVPDKAGVEALNTAAQKAKVTLISPQGTSVKGLSKTVVNRQLPISQNGQVQGVILIDSRVMVLGNLSEKGKYSATNNPNITYSMQENLQQLIKRASP